jgi:hypothetical protein
MKSESTVTVANELLSMSQVYPLSFTLQLHGIPPISTLEMVYWLSAKDTSTAKLEEKCQELRSNIHTLILDSFSSELAIESPSLPTA